MILMLMIVLMQAMVGVTLVKMTVMMMMMMQTFERSPRPNKQSIIQVLSKIFTVTEKAVFTNTNTIHRTSCIDKHKYNTDTNTSFVQPMFCNSR